MTIDARTHLVVAEALHGGYGEAGPIIDTVTGAEKYALTDAEASTLLHRLAIFIPSGDAALVFNEHAGRRDAGRVLIHQLDDLWKSRFPNHDLERHVVVEKDAWFDEARLKRASVMYSHQFEIDDRVTGVNLPTEVRVMPPRNVAARRCSPDTEHSTCAERSNTST